MRIKMTVAYDGTNYYGFQHQSNFINIEDELVFSKDGDRVWICRNCGHICVGKKAHKDLALV